MNTKTRYIRGALLGLVLFIGASWLMRDSAGPERLRVPRAPCISLADSKPLPARPRPVLTQSAAVPYLCKVDVHPECPCLTHQYWHHQEFTVLPVAPGVSTLPRCVYVRYWPRDPPEA